MGIQRIVFVLLAAVSIQASALTTGPTGLRITLEGNGTWARLSCPSQEMIGMILSDWNGKTETDYANDYSPSLYSTQVTPNAYKITIKRGPDKFTTVIPFATGCILTQP